MGNGSFNGSLSFIIRQRQPTEQFWIIPCIPSSLKIQVWAKHCQFGLFMIPMMKNRFWRKPLLKMFDTMKCESGSSCQLLGMEWPLFVEKGLNLLICKWREAMLLSPRSESLCKQFEIWSSAVEICRIRIGWLKHSEMCGDWKIFKSTS